MKAIISNKIYMVVEPSLHKALEKELTYKVPSYNAPDQFITIKNLKVINFNISGGMMLVAFPIGRMDLIPSNYEIVDKRAHNYIDDFPEFKLDLRPSQQVIVDDINDNCMINAPVGFGKTVTALALASKLKEKTLITTHTVALRNQWEKEIVKTLGIRPGVIGSGKFSIDSPVVVSNVQSLVKYTPRINREFGLLVLDECLDYNTRITTREGPANIGVIVNKEQTPEVLSYNESTKSLEWKRVVRHFKNKQTDPFIEFTFNNGSILKCTMNHNIYSVNKGKTQAENLLEGDWVFAQKTSKTSNLLSEQSKPLVLGMILGDGHLSDNNKKGISSRLSITHGEKQLEYLKYKIGLLKNGFKSNIATGNSGYSNTKVHNIHSLSFYDIDNWKSYLYKESGSKNSISEDLVNILNLDSWAIIYQDDGSINNKTISFSFCEMNEESISRLKLSLKNIFDVNPKSYTCKKGYNYITLSVEDSESFLEKTAHLIHPSMRYKLGNFDREFNPFVGSDPVDMFSELTALKIVDINFVEAYGGYRYNIEVEDNHNYFASGKLVSNCHHVSSPTFSKVVDAMFSRYKVGLSGTIERKDQKHVVFKDYFGTKIYKPERENTMTPTIDVINSGIEFPSSTNSWAEKVNALKESHLYKNLVIGLADYYSRKGHKVLIVSDRVEFLRECSANSEEPAELLIGALSEEEREKVIKRVSSGEATQLWATQSLVSEGISINPLSCLILATPLNNMPLLEQLIGRIQRNAEGKLNPVVVDIKLEGWTVKNQFNNRLGHYMKEGYEINFIK